MVDHLQIVGRANLSRGTKLEMKELGITIHYAAVGDSFMAVEFDYVTINMTGAIVVTPEFIEWFNSVVFVRMSKRWMESKCIHTMNQDKVDIQMTSKEIA